MTRDLSISLRDLYLRYPCSCHRGGTCIGCDLRAEFGPERVEQPPRPPFETFKGATCRGLTGCGTCEKCVWYKEHENVHG